MKTLLLVLALFVSIGGWSQSLKLNNSTVTIGSNGTNGADWQVALVKKTGAATTYSNSVMEFTTTGAINKNGGFKVFYMHFDVNDKAYFVITRTSGSGDFTITSSSVYFEQYYGG